MHEIRRGFSALAFACAVAALVPPSTGATAIVSAVGDGAVPTPAAAETASLVEGGSPAYFLYLGDVYDAGTSNEFARNYEPTYGRVKSVTRPTPGNHEWPNRATGYDPYWGAAYSSPHYYSFDAGGWHLVSLNSEQSMSEDSAQLQWLRADLATHPGTCTLAYWHRPRYSAGSHGDNADLDPLWHALAGHAAVVLNGHDHNYQRMTPIDGITEFVVGTGGKSLYPLSSAYPTLAVSNQTSYGVLRLTLSEGRGDFAFIGTTGTQLDAGSIACLDRAPPTVSALTLSSRRPRVKRRARHLDIGFVLSEAATVELQFQRRSRGRYRTVLRLSSMREAGLHSLRVERSVLHRLRPGVARAILNASDSAGNASQQASVELRLVR